MADTIYCKQVQGDACGEERSKASILHEEQRTEVSRSRERLRGYDHLRFEMFAAV